MNHDIIKKVIFDQHEIIKNSVIIDRPRFVFEDNANYILTGLRRSGKSTLLYSKVLDLIKGGVSYNQIIYINFEDDRLLEFKLKDFDDILEVSHELSNSKKYYFFDEIQNIYGWEKFARRIADSKEFVYITGSNAKMLSREMEMTLGGRYISKYITPYSFNEYLKANKFIATQSTKSIGNNNALFNNYLEFGGLPETILLKNKREYIQGVYQKVLLNDIILHNNIRNENAIKVLIKKIAETVKDEMSYTKLFNVLKTIGFTISKDTIIDYISHAKDSYLIFDIKNYYSSFIDKESVPKYYFTDNGVLNLFLDDKKGILLENIVAAHLKQKYPKNLYYIKSSKTGIDVDFYIPSKYAIQVAYTLGNPSSETHLREINNLIKLKHITKEPITPLIITTDKSQTISINNENIEVVNIIDFITNKSKRFCVFEVNGGELED